MPLSSISSVRSARRFQEKRKQRAPTKRRTPNGFQFQLMKSEVGSYEKKPHHRAGKDPPSHPAGTKINRRMILVVEALIATSPRDAASRHRQKFRARHHRPQKIANSFDRLVGTCLQKSFRLLFLFGIRHATIHIEERFARPGARSVPRCVW